MTQEFVTLPREVVEQALDALKYERTANNPLDWHHDKTMQALRAALEQPQVEQEPVGFVRQIDIEQIAKTPSDWGAMFGKVMGFNTVPVYTHPQPKREPLTPLTDEQLKAIINKIDRDEQYIQPALRQLARAIEAAHNIK